MERNRVLTVLRTLQNCYPEAKTALNFSNPFELLVATMLSAQSTDRQVNHITDHLFRLYRTPREYAALEPEELAGHIRGVGLYQTKSGNIVAAARLLVEKFGGKVPGNMEDLVQLPGVGRKTANVVLANAFGQPAIAVDTHVFRVANRIGLARSKDVRGTEEDLRGCIPRSMWADAHHWLIYHGRQVCRARNPRCDACAIKELCETGQRSKKTGD